jgi:hypothetical protein
MPDTRATVTKHSISTLPENMAALNNKDPGNTEVVEPAKDLPNSDTSPQHENTDDKSSDEKDPIPVNGATK